MAIGADKLKAFAKQGGHPGGGGGGKPQKPAGGEGPGDQAFDQQHGEHPPEGSPEDMALDAPDNLSTDAMKHRLMEPHVGYLEMDKPVGSLACSGCYSFNEDGFCANQSVLAYVSPEKGHCNLFQPLEGEAVSPDEWEGLKNAPDREAKEHEEPEEEEHEPEDEEKDEEPAGGEEEEEAPPEGE